MKIDLKNPTVSTIVTFYLIALFGYFPLAIASYGGLTSFKMTNFILITVVAAVISVMTVFTRLTGKESFKFKDFIKNISVTVWFFIGFVIVQLVSALFSPYQGSGVWTVNGRCEGMLIQLLYTLVFLGVCAFARFDKFYIYLIAVILILMNVIAVVQLFGINAFSLYPEGTMFTDKYFGVFYSTIGNIDMLGGFYCVTVPIIAAGFVVFSHKLWQNALLLIAAAASVYVVIEINVSATLLAFAALCALTFPLYVVKGKINKLFGLCSVVFASCALAFICDRTPNADNTAADLTFTLSNAVYILMALGVVCAVISILVKFVHIKVKPRTILLTLYIAEILVVLFIFIYIKYIMQIDDNTNDLLREISNFMNGNITMHSGSRRIAIWSCSVMVLEKYPILGVGPGVFADAFSDIAGETYKQYSSLAVDMAHNEYLQIACSYGIIGLIAYLGFIGSLIFRALRRFFKNDIIKVLLPAVICYTVQAFFSFSIVFVFPIFVAISALLESEIRNS